MSHRLCLIDSGIMHMSHKFSGSNCTTESIGLNLEVQKEQLTALISTISTTPACKCKQLKNNQSPADHWLLVSYQGPKIAISYSIVLSVTFSHYTKIVFHDEIGLKWLPRSFGVKTWPSGSVLKGKITNTHNRGSMDKKVVRVEPHSRCLLIEILL